MATGAAGAAMAWLGPQLGWVPRANAATPPAKPTGQAVIGFSQEPTVFNPLMLHIEVDEGVYFNLFSAALAARPRRQPDPRSRHRDPDGRERRHLRRRPQLAAQVQGRHQVA